MKGMMKKGGAAYLAGLLALGGLTACGDDDDEVDPVTDAGMDADTMMDAAVDANMMDAAPTPNPPGVRFGSFYTDMNGDAAIVGTCIYAVIGGNPTGFPGASIPFSAVAGPAVPGGTAGSPPDYLYYAALAQPLPIGLAAFNVADVQTPDDPMTADVDESVVAATGLPAITCPTAAYDSDAKTFSFTDANSAAVTEITQTVKIGGTELANEGVYSFYIIGSAAVPDSATIAFVEDSLEPSATAGETRLRFVNAVAGGGELTLCHDADFVPNADPMMIVNGPTPGVAIGTAAYGAAADFYTGAPIVGMGDPSFGGTMVLVADDNIADNDPCNLDTQVPDGMGGTMTVANAFLRGAMPVPYTFEGPSAAIPGRSTEYAADKVYTAVGAATGGFGTVIGYESPARPTN